MPSSQPTPALATWLCAAALMCATRPALGQNFTIGVTRANEVFRDGILPDSLTNIFDPTGLGLKGGLSVAMATGLTYDSNITLAASDPEDDLVFSISPSLLYTSDPEGGAPNRITAFFSPSYNVYFEDTGRNALNHRLGLALTMGRAKTSVSAFADYSQNSGADRFTGTFSEGAIFRAGLGVNYQIAPRTVIYADFSGARSEYDTGGFVGSDIYSATSGFFWSATERLKFGPALGYEVIRSESTGRRESLSLSGRAGYLWTERVNLSASLGVSSSEDSRQGGREIGLVADGSLSYTLNSRWSFSGSFAYGTVPSPVASNFLVQDFSFGIGVTRALTRGQLRLGVDVGITTFEQVGVTTATEGNDLYSSIALTYSRLIFRDRVAWDSTISYSRGDGESDFTRYQITTGLSTTF